MQTITIGLNRIDAEMLKELKRKNKLFRNLEKYLIEQIESEYSKITSKQGN